MSEVLSCFHSFVTLKNLSIDTYVSASPSVAAYPSAITLITELFQTNDNTTSKSAGVCCIKASTTYRTSDDFFGYRPIFFKLRILKLIQLYWFVPTLEEITESEMTEEDTGKSEMSQVLYMAVSEDARKIGRPKKEICYLPAWNKRKNLDKKRIEQVESKVLTGKFLYLPKANTNNKSREPEQLSLKRQNLKKKKRCYSEDDIFLEDQVVEGIGSIDIGSHSMYSANIHPQIDLRFATEVDVKEDGFCGFRCLAFEIYGDQELFWKAKIKMRDVFSKMLSFTATVFLITSRKVIGSNVVKWSLFFDEFGQKDISAPLRYGFYNPGCTQLAADTFRRPVATTTDVVVEKDEDPMRKDPSFKRPLWYTILHFVPKFEFTPARVEDVIDLETPSN
ncbi:hypothetical protein BD770DRAFT_409639 [Pilaira anomala]|nr:hypothetical protein BD770DRAFT_409639 [Pilaira anomala]